MIDQARLREIVAKVIAEIGRPPGAPSVEPAPEPASAPAGAVQPGQTPDELVIDLPDPTTTQERRRIKVDNPHDPQGLRDLCAATTARLAFGRAGARPATSALLLFQADHAVTQDAIHGRVSPEVLARFGLFTAHSRASDREEYLLRPDLGRLLSDEARVLVGEKCAKAPDVQIVIGDGLSAAAIDNNLPDIYPVIERGLTAAGLRLGVPFFVDNCRVGVINDVNAIIGAKVVLLLIGERPGLGIADAMSVYMGFDPRPGKSDADRDLICMITTNGGTNPLEAGAYVVEFTQRMLEHQASGVRLRELAA